MKPTVSLLIPFKSHSKKVNIKYDPSLHERPPGPIAYPRIAKRSKKDGTIIEIDHGRSK
jgi:hypothetical protein